MPRPTSRSAPFDEGVLDSELPELSSHLQRKLSLGNPISSTPPASSRGSVALPHAHILSVPGELGPARQPVPSAAEREADLSSSASRFLLFNSGLCVLVASNGMPRWISARDASAMTNDIDSGRRALPRLWLAKRPGEASGAFCAFHLKKASEVAQNDESFVNVREIAAQLPNVASLAANARALFAFHASHRFCPRCGAATHADFAGARRVCHGGCGSLWRPRREPVVVVLVLHGQKILLVRKQHYNTGEVRCVSGYVEHGESVEDAARRRVEELLDVELADVRLFTSMPWPYPHCLLLGCVGRVISDDVDIETDSDIEEVRWFSRDEARQLSNVQTDGEAHIPEAPRIIGELVRAFVDDYDVCRFDEDEIVNGEQEPSLAL